MPPNPQITANKRDFCSILNSSSLSAAKKHFQLIEIYTCFRNWLALSNSLQPYVNFLCWFPCRCFKKRTNEIKQWQHRNNNNNQDQSIMIKNIVKFLLNKKALISRPPEPLSRDYLEIMWHILIKFCVLKNYRVLSLVTISMQKI